MAPLRRYHVVALLFVCFLVGQIAAAPLPGVKWSALEIWEGSAAADVWLYAADYLDFRKYALSGLSDLGFLDHLLRLFPGTLQRPGRSRSQTQQAAYERNKWSGCTLLDQSILPRSSFSR